MALASSSDDGVAALNAGDYVTAHQSFLPLADAGDPDAQVILGVLYSNGQGVTQDYKQAIKWYRLSAEQGNAKD